MADDDMPVASRLTTRNGVCQYVRRVPEDLRDVLPFARVQRSLHTRDHRQARQAAPTLDQDATFASPKHTCSAVSPAMWQENRRIVKKQVSAEYLREMGQYHRRLYSPNRNQGAASLGISKRAIGGGSSAFARSRYGPST